MSTVPLASDVAPNDMPTRKPKRAFSYARAVAMLARNRTYEEVAESFGLAKSTVFEKMAPFRSLIDKDRVAMYEANRTAILSAVEMETVCLLTDSEKRAKASLNNVAYTFTQIHQARRLEAGQSTANLALHELVERVEHDRTRRLSPSPAGGGATPSRALDAPQVAVTTDVSA